MSEADHEKRIQKLERALFGDGNGNIGMEKKLDAMYEIFTGASFTWSFFIKVIVFLGTVAVGYAAFLKIISFWKGN